MSKIEKLLEGVEVEWKALGEISNIYGGLTGKGKADFVSGNSSYISYKNIYDNIEVNLSKLESVKIADSENQNEVKYGDVLFTGSSETADEAGISSAVTTKFLGRVYLNSFSFGLRFNDDIEIIPEFSKYLFRSHFMRLEISKTASGVTRYNISKARFKKILIPIPPISAQKEIVRILDTFTERTETLINELTTELEARKKQYNYYREKLLSFEEGQNSCLNQDLQDSQNFQDKVEWKTLGEVAEIGTGSHNTQDAEDDGEYTFYARGITPLKLNSYDFEETAIITAGDGVGVGKVFHWVVGKYALHQRAYRIVPNEKEIYPRFVYHYIVAKFYLYIEKTSVSSSVTSMRKPMFLKFPIPVPSLKEQTRIVAILDKLDSLTASISEALPKEIALRKKQYEYYRDRLLTFK